MSSTPLSAAQLMQQAHESKSASATTDILTSDPFPVASLADAAAANKPTRAAKQPSSVDVSDESAFPSLGGPAANGQAPKSLWGGGGAAALRVKQQTTAAGTSPALSRSSTPASGADSPQVHTVTFQLPTSAIHISAPPPQRGPRGFSNERRDDPKTLGEVLKEVMRRHEGVQVEASSSSKLTTFILRARGANAESKVEKTKVELLAWLEKRVSEVVEVPASLRAVIIGSKGRTLKSITDSTGASIQIPRDDEIPAPSSPSPADSEDGPLIPITLTGPSSSVSSARAQILAIVRERTSKTSVSVPEIPSELWALLNVRVKGLLEKLEVPEGEVNVFVPRRAVGRRGVDVVADAAEGAEEKDEQKQVKEKAVQVSGDKETVKRVVEALEAEVAELRATVRPVTFPLPKRQHRFLVGTAIADQILEQTGCAVEIPAAENPSEDVVVRGPGRNTVQAMQLVFDLASATPVETLDLFTAHRGSHDPRVYATHLARYLLVKSRLRPIALASGTQIYLPRIETIPSLQNAWLEIVGSSGEEGTGAQGVAQARQAVIGEVRRLTPAVFASVEVDPLLHRHLIGKKGSKVRQFEKDKSVEVIFPPAEKDSSDVLLVYTGEDAAAAPAALAEVREAILALAAEFADLVTVTLSIPSALHGAIIGQNGTTLNAVLGEEKLAHVVVGGGAGKEDEVLIRGPKDEVERVKGEIERIAEDAKNEEIVNSHVVEFEIATEHVRHIVGKAGSGVNKLRDDLGVRVDFGEAGKGGKKGPTSTVTVKGRKENAEEARKRIKALVEKIADEVTLTIPLPSSLDRGSLIGKQGSFLKRLEDRYEVRVNFPRDGRKSADDSAPSTPSSAEITVRGPSKGAQAAKSELVALIEYEKEHGNTVSFEVAVKALPRILGRGGSQINQIKDDTGVAALDVDQESPEATTATITLRGTKSSIKKAREAVEKIAEEVQDEARLEIDIPREYHRTLVGAGGSSIRDLIARCGGPTDARASGNAVRFPRQGDSKETVIITAPTAVANKIREALQAEVAQLASRVVWGVVADRAAHPAIIGKGAQALQQLQREHGVRIVMPGWNEYSQVGEVENSEDVASAEERDIVKVVGPKEAALAAATAIQAVAQSAKGRAGAGAANGSSSRAAHSIEVSVPKALHAQVAQGGRFFRTLPSGVRIQHKGIKPPSSALKAKKPPAASNGATRIDDDADAPAEGLEFQLVPLVDEDAAEAGEIPWVVESANEETAQKVADSIRKAVEKAETATHVGWVTVPRGLMPRIVGRGGSGLERLRSEGVEVEIIGKRDANQLTLTGSPASIDAAYDVIRELNEPRRREARIDDY
ncbi:hypothetical protein JCM10213_005247 [Rhodosporidiobolus nylandii]